MRDVQGDGEPAHGASPDGNTEKRTDGRQEKSTLDEKDTRKKKKIEGLFLWGGR